MFSAKLPPEIITLTFDFSALNLASIANPVMTVTSDSGLPDTSPSALLSGAPQVSGQTVLQKVIGGRTGSHYEFHCQITAPDGSVYMLEEVLPVL